MTKKENDGETKISKLRIEDRNHLLFSTFIIVITALLVVNTLFWLDSKGKHHPFSSPSSSTINNSDKVLTSQQIATSQVYEISIANVTELSKTDPAFRLEDGQVLLMFDLKIINKSLQTQDLIPANQLYVRSAEGDTFPMHVSSFVTKPLSAAKLKPNGVAEGQVSFAVPKTLSNPLVYVDLGWDDYVPVVFAVLK